MLNVEFLEHMFEGLKENEQIVPSRVRIQQKAIPIVKEAFIRYITNPENVTDYKQNFKLLRNTIDQLKGPEHWKV